MYLNRHFSPLCFLFPLPLTLSSHVFAFVTIYSTVLTIGSPFLYPFIVPTNIHLPVYLYRGTVSISGNTIYHKEYPACLAPSTSASTHSKYVTSKISPIFPNILVGYTNNFYNSEPLKLFHEICQLIGVFFPTILYCNSNFQE